MVGQAYEGGDPVAIEVLRETVEVLSLWLSNIVDLLEPDVMILGGGVAAMLSSSFDEIRKQIEQYCVNSRRGDSPAPGTLRCRYWHCWRSSTLVDRP